MWLPYKGYLQTVIGFAILFRSMTLTVAVGTSISLSVKHWAYHRVNCLWLVFGEISLPRIAEVTPDNLHFIATWQYMTDHVLLELFVRRGFKQFSRLLHHRVMEGRPFMCTTQIQFFVTVGIWRPGFESLSCAWSALKRTFLPYL